MCVLHEHDISAEDVFLLLFFSFSAARQYEERRTPVLGIRENASEHRRDCVSAIV